jgi:SAM-dependent methyltransferase
VLSDQTSYSGKLLKGGRGLVAWQRLARFRRCVEAVQHAFPAGKVDLLVDVGAADGIGLPFWDTLARNVLSINYYQVHAEDFKAQKPGRWGIRADVQRLPLPTHSTDVLVSLETLHLLPGVEARERALAELHRVLKPNGLLLCSVAIEVGLPAITKFIGRRMTGFDVDGMTVGLMLKHVFHRWTDVSQYDRGEQIGFHAYRFAAQMGRHFRLERRIRVPLMYPLCTNLLLVARPSLPSS